MSWLLHLMQINISRGYMLLPTAYEIWLAAFQTYYQLGNNAQIYELVKRAHETKQG